MKPNVPTIPVCVAYRDGSEVLDTIPETQALARVSPVYEELPGWCEETCSLRSVEALPAAARAWASKPTSHARS